MIKKRLRLSFPKSAVDKPVVYHLVRDFNLIVNIFRANISDEEVGYIALNVGGTEEDIQDGIDFMKSLDVEVDEITKGLRWDKNRCTSCSNCVTHCPTGALSIVDRNTMTVGYNELLCVECLSCIKNCPFGVCSVMY